MNRLFILFLLFFITTSAQEIRTDSLAVIEDDIYFPSEENEIIKEIEESNKVTTNQKLNPTKAGLYSAVLPGLGQYYNKKYWKIPIVWGGIGTGVGVTLWYDKQYKRYRKAFINELNGLPHEFSDKDYITAEMLGTSQDQIKRQRDYAIAITGLVYVLNIIDAVVDAHLFQGRNDPDLALSPTILHNQNAKVATVAGLSFNYKF